MVDTTLADRILAFDDRGVLRAEAGVSLGNSTACCWPGWFVPVSPGTQYVTLGGMIASDVHGKNHHVDGCFGQHVLGLTLRVADGRIIECSPEQEPELFWATVGGMGLTGHILEATVQMSRIPSPWIWGESQRMGNLDAMVAGLKEAAQRWPMTVGWVDCLARGAGLGRGILMKGRWANADEAPSQAPAWKRHLRVPFCFPNFALCRLSMKAFNLLYYWKHFQRLQARHRPSRIVLLSAGRARRLEPDLRQSRLHAVPVRPAARGRQRAGPPLPGAVHVGRGHGVSVRDQGLRRRGQGPLVVPPAGRLDRHGFPDPSPPARRPWSTG